MEIFLFSFLFLYPLYLPYFNRKVNFMGSFNAFQTIRNNIVTNNKVDILRACFIRRAPALQAANEIFHQI